MHSVPAHQPPPDGLLLSGGLFTAVELRAMALDGLVERVYAEAYAGVGAAATPALRAAAAGSVVPPVLAGRAVVGRDAAAWVYGCAPAPEKVALLVHHDHRTTELPPFSGCTIHEVPLGPFDAIRLGGVLVATPLRTAVDVALSCPPAVAHRVLAAMAAAAALNCPLGLIRSAVAATARARGRPQALDLLDAMTGRS
ncbi:hypothetical protein ACQCSX_05415 [Pseudarthrobacter sp. P1]|uniref:hypothetical protein n=1 Tax=Pseudarthrobacter sp. P1 TaxID=3418418 RepID=UPI003CE88C8D